MKLPDFRKDADLNALKSFMGLPHHALGSLGLLAMHLTADEAAALLQGDGLEVAAETVRLDRDGAFVFKGARFVIYIRDVADYGTITAPRYHLVSCPTVQLMSSAGRLDRYVVNAEPSGCFAINIIKNNRVTTTKRPLKVCQNCLQQLNYAGFSFSLPQHARNGIISAFKLGSYLASSKAPPFRELPAYDTHSAPLNVYRNDFGRLADTLKAAADYTCAQCSTSFKAPEHRRSLHVHHRNGAKFDDRRRNLQVLCRSCHARQPLHGHLRGGRKIGGGASSW
ncbi:HNH endonuclease signature motif containing protein [Nostoc sp. NIES-2111]